MPICSLIVNVLESYEVVRRQLLHLERSALKRTRLPADMHHAARGLNESRLSNMMARFLLFHHTTDEAC